MIIINILLAFAFICYFLFSLLALLSGAISNELFASLMRMGVVALSSLVVGVISALGNWLKYEKSKYHFNKAKVYDKKAHLQRKKIKNNKAVSKKITIGTAEDSSKNLVHKIVEKMIKGNEKDDSK